MQLCLLGYFLTFIEVCSFVFSRITVNDFVRVQSGAISSSECSIDELPVGNSTTSAQMQCGLLCSSSDLCFGMEIIGEDAKQCRLLFGFDVLKSSHKTSKQVIRYQKLTGTNTVERDSYCTIQLTNGIEISTLCNQGVHKWMLMQRRIDGSVNFTRDWADYENGFGCLGSEFWLGNRNIHELTNDGYTYLRIEMMDHDNVWKYAEYSTFNVESDSFKYRLNVKGYSGNAGKLAQIIDNRDSLWLHDGKSFTTYDNDNDNNGTINCGSLFRGGWWYHTCHTANLNGEYGNTIKSKGINWYYWKGFYYSMKEVRMMVRKP